MSVINKPLNESAGRPQTAAEQTACVEIINSIHCIHSNALQAEDRLKEMLLRLRGPQPEGTVENEEIPSPGSLLSQMDRGCHDASQTINRIHNLLAEFDKLF